MASCGGDERLSRSEFVQRADAICAKYQRRSAAIPRPRTIADVPSFIDRGIPLAKDELAELDALRPPKEDEAEVDRMLAEVRTTIAELERLRRIAASRDRLATEAAAARVEASGERAAELAGRYGLDECGSSE